MIQNSLRQLGHYITDDDDDDGAIQHAYQNAFTHIEKMHADPLRNVSHVGSWSTLNKVASSIVVVFDLALKVPSHNANDAHLAATRK